MSTTAQARARAERRRASMQRGRLAVGRQGHGQSFAHPIASSRATLTRWATETLRGLDSVQRTSKRVARGAEQGADVRRQVREEVARIGVFRDAPARQLRLEAVRRPAAVGVDQAADEVARISVDDLLLPVLERDLALVLAATAVLREGEQPSLLQDCTRTARASR